MNETSAPTRRALQPSALAQRSKSIRFPILLLAFAAAFISSLAARDAVAATIYVTTTKQKISGTGGCSLQEAIWGSRLHLSAAIAHYDGFGNATAVATQCTAGTGDDVIVLPNKATLSMTCWVQDGDNSMGPSATPMITSKVTIQGNGATLRLAPSIDPIQRYFPCNGLDGLTSVPVGMRVFSINDTGHLELHDVRISDFVAKGGDGGEGSGGGGLGAGGAIYVQGGGVAVFNSTFDGNGAVGGNGGAKVDRGDTLGGGGGGGLGGDGGDEFPALVTAVFSAGAGGGGARGAGEGNLGNDGGGGGGTVLDDAVNAGGFDGFDCGGNGGSSGSDNGGDQGAGGNGGSATCPGGGGGGGGSACSEVATAATAPTAAAVAEAREAAVTAEAAALAAAVAPASRAPSAARMAATAASAVVVAARPTATSREAAIPAAAATSEGTPMRSRVAAAAVSAARSSMTAAASS